jgi:lipoprotein-anchoring transpeptidase ErfK/SrfK
MRAHSSALLVAVLLAALSPAVAAPRIVDLPEARAYPIGTIVIVNDERRLYYVVGRGRAIQYPVAVGTAEELWVGRTFVSEKKENPRWVPDDGREPVEGGHPANPLGQRAIYLDWSLLRIHGTNARGSIGSGASAGCIRMFNEDVVDLYARVHLGAPVIAVWSRFDIGTFAEARVTGKVVEE